MTEIALRYTADDLKRPQTHHDRPKAPYREVGLVEESSKLFWVVLRLRTRAADVDGSCLEGLVGSPGGVLLADL